MKPPTSIFISPFDVSFLISRDRNRAEFERQKQSIRELGVVVPVQVRDIRAWPAEKRKRPDGGHYKWQAVCGQGRCTACIELFEETKDPSWLKVPATVEELPESLVVGRFLNENLMHRKKSWHEQARLIKADVDAGLSVEQIAKGLFVTAEYVAELLRTMNRLDPAREKEVRTLSLAQAKSLSTLAQPEQAIVLDTLKEERMRPDQVPAIVRKAQRLKEDTGTLSKHALRQSLQRVKEDLKELREALKVKRRDQTFGPDNLRDLCKKPEFRKALQKRGIDFKAFTPSES